MMDDVLHMLQTGVMYVGIAILTCLVCYAIAWY